LAEAKIETLNREKHRNAQIHCDNLSISEDIFFKVTNLLTNIDMDMNINLKITIFFCHPNIFWEILNCF